MPRSAAALGLLAACAVAVLSAQRTPLPRHNVIIFVADGMRPGSVNATDTPAFWHIRTSGVNFTNSHAVFPSLTMPNAAAIATGLYPGDSGQFANNLFGGYPQFNTGNFGRTPGALTGSAENDLVLADLDSHFGGHYLGAGTLLELARARGYHTASVGKLGPTALQDIGELNPKEKIVAPATVVLDAVTGTANGVPVSAEVAGWLKEAGLPAGPPARSQPSGSYLVRGALSANVTHQQWLADAVTKAILPKFSASGQPFILLFWSGDPDQTQHAQGDSMNQLAPGINGPTSKAGVRNADNNLRQILEYVEGHPRLQDTTDIFVTADHGFSTVTRRQLDASGRTTQSYSTRVVPKDAEGRQLVAQGALPNGYMAVDLAHALNLPLYDPDLVVEEGNGRFYERVDPAGQPSARSRQMLSSGSGLLGGTGRVSTPVDANIVVAFPLIYVLDNSRDTVTRIVNVLAQQDYVGGLFVNDAFGRIPGTLPMSDVRLMGKLAKTPRPAIVVNPLTYSTDPRDPLMTSVIVGGTQQEGQGNHGALARANTFNNMAAIGPDFKRGYQDAAPVGNVDVAPTLASILGLKLPGAASVRGRVIREALAGGPASVPFVARTVESPAARSGKKTILRYQEGGGVRYLDEAEFR